jgi:hypothetical protein
VGTETESAPEGVVALLAESLVEEWLNRQGFFTIRGIKEGIGEIDLLAVRHGSRGEVEARHVEVQISFRPIGYLTPLSKPLTKSLGKARGYVFGRKPAMLAECVEHWVHNKFHSKKKAKLRDDLWPHAEWRYVLVHGVVKEPEELKLIAAAGVELTPLRQVLLDLCPADARPAFTAGPGGDLADLIAFFADVRKEPRPFDSA